MVQHDSPPQGGNSQYDPPKASSAHVLMCNETIDLTTRSKTYEQTPNLNASENVKGKNIIDENSFTPPPNGSLHIEKPISDTILRPPKNTIRKVVFNPNARVVQNYNIVEDLAQAPCAMSTLEVLQNCPAQCKTLLAALGAIEPVNSNHLMFSLENFKTRLSHQLAFQINTSICGKNIHRTILDEGASTYIMSLSCWRAIGSPEVRQSPTTLKAFDG